MEGFGKEVIDVYSEKYGVHGQVLDYIVVIDLVFCYENREIVIGLDRRHVGNKEALKKQAEETIDTFIEKLQSGEIKLRKVMLHYWFVEKKESNITGEEYLQAHGIVTGHNRLMDATFINTSAVKEIIINHDTKEAEIHTMNTVYFCPLSYCDFKRQDKWKDVISDYDALKEKYQDTIKNPSIEAGNVLLTISNFDEFYFHSLYYIPEGETDPVKYSASPHIGTFQDSFLIEDEDWDKIDIRYFPHYQNIEFYSEFTDGRPLFVENIGDITLYVKAGCGTIRLEPGDRKEVVKENTDSDIKGLPGGDLYPAGIIE